jgi:hypothetical protein
VQTSQIGNVSERQKKNSSTLPNKIDRTVKKQHKQQQPTVAELPTQMGQRSGTLSSRLLVRKQTFDK